MEQRIQKLFNEFENVVTTPLYTQENKEERVREYLDEGFCVFGFWGIDTFIHDIHKIEKKKPIGLPLDWPNLKKPENEAYLNYKWRGWGIITGKESGVTVLDFDKTEDYRKLVQIDPSLLMCKTVLTNKGAHIYFKYDPDLPTGTNVLSKLNGVDLRNDNAIAFCNPTQYDKLDGTIVTYTDAGGEIMEIPSYLKEDIIKTHNSKHYPDRVFLYDSLN